MNRLILTAILSIVAIGVAGASDTPYAGQQIREIKALSNQAIEDYLNGNGMGYAKAAELNNYPGPRHVLDLASDLELTDEQLKQTRRIFNAMKVEATRLGAQLVEKEKELDRKFADAEIDEDTLNELVSGIGVLEAKIRWGHLKAHLDQREVLNEHQVVRYAALRGYTGAREIDHGHAH